MQRSFRRLSAPWQCLLSLQISEFDSLQAARVESPHLPLFFPPSMASCVPRPQAQCPSALGSPAGLCGAARRTASSFKWRYASDVSSTWYTERKGSSSREQLFKKQSVKYPTWGPIRVIDITMLNETLP